MLSELATYAFKEIAKEGTQFLFEELGKRMSPTELLLKGEKSGISGDFSEITDIKSEVENKKEVNETSDYSDEVNDNIRTQKELEVYEDTNLEEAEVNERTVLKDNSIDPSLQDEKGRTNVERMQKGKAPLDENGDSYNLHHIGQKFDAPLAELKNRTHKSQYSTLHDTSIKESDIDRGQFAKERAEHWKARAKELEAKKDN